MSGVIRVGRGGAGNFMSQEEVEEAEKAQKVNFPSYYYSKGEEGALMQPTSQQDPEFQKPSSPPPPSAAQTVVHTPQYVRSGRGGAGNFADPPTVSDAQDRQDVVDRTKAAVSASQAGRPRTGLVGRGGAGNWTDDGGAAATTAGGGGAEGNEEDDKEETRRQQIAEQIAQDIEASLPAPPKTYHQHDRDME